jgi:hypothetical protein
MIGPGAGVRAYLACGITGIRFRVAAMSASETRRGRQRCARRPHSATSCSMTAAMIVSLFVSGIGGSFLVGGTSHTLDSPVAAPRSGSRQPLIGSLLQLTVTSTGVPFVECRITGR